MLTIKKVILENFQSHKYTSLDFTEGLNAIVGPTDSGKTAIFRAIKWALYNEPQGDYFIREGATEVSVKIEFNNGLFLNRYRTRSKNGYELTYPNGEVLTFEGFGTKVPDEVVEATRMRKIQLTPTENRSLNLAEQLDGPFLLSETPSIKAAAIGKLVEADLVDYALSEVNNDLRTLKRDHKKSKESLEGLEASLKSYSYLDNLQKTIGRIEKLEKSIEDKQKQLARLEAIYENYDKLNRNKNYLEDNLLKLQGIDRAEKSYFNLEALAYRYKDILRLKDNIEHNKTSKNQTLGILSALDGIGSLEGQTGLLSEKVRFLGMLEQTRDKYQLVMMRKQAISQDYNKLKKIDSASRMSEKIEKSIDLYTRNKTYLTNLKILEKRIGDGQVYMKNFDGLEEGEKRFDSLVMKVDRLERLNKISSEYKRLTYKIQNEVQGIKNYEGQIDKIYEAYKDLIVEMKVCPTCKRPFDMTNTEEVIRHLSE